MSARFRTAIRLIDKKSGSRSGAEARTLSALYGALFENERVDAVERYGVLDTPPEGAFDRITRLAAQIFDVPFAAISIVDRDRTWFKSVFGFAGPQEVPREESPCSSAIASREAYIVEDASDHLRLRYQGYVSGTIGLRFYVGMPLVSSDGYNLGVLSVCDTVAHAADPRKVAVLSDLAKVVVDELELRLATRRLGVETSLRLDAQAGEATATAAALVEASLRAGEEHFRLMVDISRFSTRPKMSLRASPNRN